ncbi:hypothetical protein [Sphingobacterium ginsenosidimutans]
MTLVVLVLVFKACSISSFNADEIVGTPPELGASIVQIELFPEQDGVPNE